MDWTVKQRETETTCKYTRMGLFSVVEENVLLIARIILSSSIFASILTWLSPQSYLLVYFFPPTHFRIHLVLIPRLLPIESIFGLLGVPFTMLLSHRRPPLMFTSYLLLAIIEYCKISIIQPVRHLHLMNGISILFSAEVSFGHWSVYL